MTADYKLIGDSIRARRKELKLTQSQLAKKAGTSQGYIADTENGNLDNPSLKKLKKIADALQINLQRLFAAAESDEEFYITNKETKLLEKYRLLSFEQQIKLEGIIEGMLISTSNEETDKKGA